MSSILNKKHQRRIRALARLSDKPASDSKFRNGNGSLGAFLEAKIEERRVLEMRIHNHKLLSA